MLRNNRKKRKNDVFMFPAPFAGAVIVVALSAMAYVGLGLQEEALGRELKKLEAKKSALEEQYRIEAYRWTQLKSPANLERELRARGIQMQWPSSGQIIYLSRRDLQDGYRSPDGDDDLKYAKATTEHSQLGVHGYSWRH